MTWWRHQMETFSALLAICAGNSPVPGKFPTQRPVTRSFDVYFDLRPNKRLSKQWWGWWFETQSCPLWRHRIDLISEHNAVHDNVPTGTTIPSCALICVYMWNRQAHDSAIAWLHLCERTWRVWVTLSYTLHCDTCLQHMSVDIRNISLPYTLYSHIGFIVI